MQFSLLTTMAQHRTIVKRAVQVGCRFTPDSIYYLFQLDSFYIQIRADLQGNAYKNVISFSDNEILDEYLKTIDISEFQDYKFP